MNKKKQTILIVDDNPLNIDLLNNTLKDIYNITAVTNGKQALDILEKNPAHNMILLDIMMPDMNGYEVCKGIKRNPKTREIPIIFVTAMGDEEDEAKGLEIGAVDYITKPINGAITKARIKTHLDLCEQKYLLEQKVQEETAKRLEQQKLLLHQSRLSAMGEMIAMIAHQWRQPLNNISTMIHTITMRYKLNKLDNEIMEKFNEDSTRQINYMSNTINDFRNFFHPTIDKEYFKIYNIIEKSINLFDPSKISKDIKLIVDCEDDLEIYGYKNELGQVILNLLSNSKYALDTNSHSDKWIRIKGIKSEKGICLTIHDNAGGIKNDIIDTIFDPYFSTKSDKNGTGLGLYMAKVIIEDHMKGKIYVRNIDNGAKFFIEIPIK